MPLQDVIVTVEMSSEQEHMSDCFGSKFDEYTIHANQNGEEEDTARDECISQYSSLPDSAIVARRGNPEFFICCPHLTSLQTIYTLLGAPNSDIFGGHALQKFG